MQLFVRAPDSDKELALEVEATASVGQLRALIAERFGFPVCGVAHEGRELHVDGATLEASGIGPGAVLQLLPRPSTPSVNIFVKVLGGQSVTLMLASSETVTVAQLQAQLSALEGLEAGRYDLMFLGQKLDPSKTLSSYQIASESTLEAIIPTAPMSIPKGRCAVENCGERIAKIVGECRYCGQGYCSRHRLPESHSCDNLQCCRQQSYEKNSSKLLNEKCVADKV